VCNLYSITTNQAAIIALFRVINRYVGNLPRCRAYFLTVPPGRPQHRHRPELCHYAVEHATSTAHARLLFSLAPCVVAVLVKNQVGDLPGFRREEPQLGVHNLHEELALRLGKEREFALIGRLLHQLPIFQRNSDRKCG
jgi:hypothetical protein